MINTIAMDGPAGAGKSTIAKAVAKELQILYLDTGAMYRTIALFALQKGVDPNDEAQVRAILPAADIAVRYEDGVQKMLLNGEDVTSHLRTPIVSKGASDIAVHAAVRKKLVALQREVAEQQSVVMDGRDIGTYVLPNATYKFFITASLTERARRRLQELPDKNGYTQASMEQEIQARDRTDSSRAFAPLCQARDAILIDTTDMTIQEAVQTVLSYLNRPQ